MADLKEAISVRLNAGIISVDAVEDNQAIINNLILQASAALKARGVNSAKLSLTFKANIEG